MSSYGMFSSEPEKRLPTSKLPHVWIGFVFVVVFLVAEIYELAAAGFDETIVSDASITLILIGLAGWVYWLFCVHRFHQIIEETSSTGSPTSPKMAVVGHIIPFFNFYWVFKWPSALVSFLRKQGNVQIVSGYLLGALLFASILVSRFFDGAIGMAGIFSVGIYINNKMSRYLQTLAGASPHAVPPLPDEKFFRPQTPVGDATRATNLDSTAVTPKSEKL